MDIPTRDMSCKWNHTTCDLLCLAFFTYHKFLRFIQIAACIFNQFNIGGIASTVGENSLSLDF